MAIINFPPIETADENGLLALGGDLEVDSLVLAYSLGIFPWPISKEYPLAWFSPDPRGVLFTHKLHIGKSLNKVLKKKLFEVKFNTQFENVIKACKEVKRSDQNDTWITDDIVKAYTELFYQGLAYSVEVFNGEKLVGGVYGVKIHKYISGESMFHYEDNASKVALIALIKKCKKENIAFLDTQMITPVVKSLGGEYISRDQFTILLKKSRF
jgi:leucyl/phenylalanyl-tRNA--protein transferase